MDPGGRVHKPGTLHLSALMCGAHRSAVIANIGRLRRVRREKGRATEPVRAWSARSWSRPGVDVDFPVVYRALAGLDSIAQAAGRCNREGRLAGWNARCVFVPPEPPPKGALRKAAQACVWDAACSGPQTTRWRGRYSTATSSELYYRQRWIRTGIVRQVQVDRSIATLAVQFRDVAEVSLIDEEDAPRWSWRAGGDDERGTSSSSCWSATARDAG